MSNSLFLAYLAVRLIFCASSYKISINRFWRADQARSQREGGLGLGLAIADAIARTHGGDITVNSEVGVGSCFQVRLPLVS
ncbi:ATP-binding protein [Nostoc sp.]|uniref:ATP-binding protein n=1 Tax=Nostoc sp. TaxID=1180 RepID=UPI003FA5762E